MNLFNKDYYEHGVEKGISLYTKYHWIAERSLREAHWFTQHMNIRLGETILDFGCAKGFFVKALRILGYDAFGIDYSDYALNNCDPSVSQYLYKDSNTKFDYGLCKDVLEHCENVDSLKELLRNLKNKATKWIFIIPLAKNGKYIIPVYEKDITHYIRLNKEQWKEIIQDAGLIMQSAENTLFGFKEKWGSKGNLFVITNGDKNA